MPYLKDEKAMIRRFICGLPIAYSDRIEFDKPRSLEESIKKLKHFYEQLKRKAEPKRDLKGNAKVKGNRPLKWGRPQDVGEKENVVP